MSFNKYLPDPPRPETAPVSPEARAWLLRGAWYASAAMLIAGYVLMFVLWNR